LDKACVDNYVRGYTEVVIVGILLNKSLTVKLMIVCWILSCTYHYGGEYYIQR
jgi:hypothetical protein